jgi:hypothetical protein
VTLVLLDGAGALLGALPPFRVPVPHRQEVACVVAGARARYGIEVTVLRLLSISPSISVSAAVPPEGVAVSYLAETPDPVPAGRLTPVEIDLSPHPLRAPYAEPGGPAASLAWAATVLGPVRGTQLRTWNLSSIWRLAHAGGTAWLKEVPAFFRHEGAVLTWLAGRHPGLAPAPLAVDRGRVLLADVPGEDRYGAPAAERLPMLAALHRMQRAAPGDLATLYRLGVPALDPAALREVAERYGYGELVEDLDERLAELAGCGLPDTLVHGDFHPGNVRARPDSAPVVLDWGDCVVTHPGYDLLRMLEGVPPAEQAPLREAWCDWWRAAAPGCDPEHALALLPVIGALRAAAAYATFLDNIEPDEYPYHADDPAHWLSRARDRAARAGARR